MGTPGSWLLRTCMVEPPRPGVSGRLLLFTCSIGVTVVGNIMWVPGVSSVIHHVYTVACVQHAQDILAPLRPSSQFFLLRGGHWEAANGPSDLRVSRCAQG